MTHLDFTREKLLAEVQLLRQRLAELQRAGAPELPCDPHFLQTQKMELVGRLAGGIAHEFNNLLTVITGYSNLLLDRLDADDPSRAPIYEIRKAGDRAAALTQQLLAFSRKQLLTPVELDLNALVGGLSRALRALLGGAINLVLYLDPALGRVQVDAGQFEQALLKLATRAREAMPEGGRLTIETRNVFLDDVYVRAQPEVRPGYHAHLALSHTGHSLEGTALTRAFEPFPDDRASVPSGGLEMAALYGLVKQSGGHIEVESPAHHGASYRIFLPLVEQAVTAFEVPGDLAQAPTGTETIVLAEDENSIRQLTRLVLESLGYTVLDAGDGQEALEQVEQHAGPLDLLVTDVIMPRLGGRELAQRLRARHPRMKVLYLSGYANDNLGPHSLAGAGVSFLQKPFTPMTLARRVREVLDQGMPDDPRMTKPQ
jgi:signal transduction histidine kinase/CheY-like chemotaxis protein